MSDFHYNYVLVYDVPTEKSTLRNKVAQKAAEYGMTRLQLSVFIGFLTKEKLENLIVDLEQLLKDQEANVRIYAICRHVRNSEIVIVESYHPPTTTKILTSVEQQAHGVISV